jgi:uncharacterized protein Yka (UPF0111/DUF47 family)
MKSRIVEQLGQTDIILPDLVAQGLRANDRAKLRMSALQAAMQHAHHRDVPAADLSAECRSAGVDAVAIQALVSGARSGAGGMIEAPGLGRLGEALTEDVATMIKAVHAADGSLGKAAEARLAAITAALPLGQGELADSDVARLTAVGDDGADSLHRLVMDLHKALNGLAVQCADEVVAGAHTYGLVPDDKPIIAAFMGGLERTRALKFDHPGLDTTVIRAGSRLVIQNDIGTTDAHVLLVSVEGLDVTITHTDVHQPRAQFFVNLLDAFPVHWSGIREQKAAGLAKGAAFYLVTGRYQAETAERRNGLLEAVGANLVFLIDWNKARKALRKLMSNGDAVRVLAFAARSGIGHRAFLELGGADLVALAIRHAAPGRIGFGEDLGSVLGREATREFLQTALRLATEALRHGRSARSVRDALEADLVRRVERNESALLATIVRQLGLARDIAAGVAVEVADRQFHRSDTSGNALRAKHIEEKADAIAVEARSAMARTHASPVILNLVDTVESTIDELEQAAFLASLVPRELDPALLAPLRELAATAIAGTEAAICGVEAAAGLADGESADSDDALAATGRLVDLEHAADIAERAATSLALMGDFDCKTALSVIELARALERATDLLAAIGHQLHAHVMADLSN